MSFLGGMDDLKRPVIILVVVGGKLGYDKNRGIFSNPSCSNLKAFIHKKSFPE